jgi:tetratricopeptide (TPR) repeat protein/predicted Ser/Thr protein kinase
MEPQRRNPRGHLVDTLRSGTSSIRAALSQLATRRKTPESPAAPASHKPVPEGPRWGQLVLLDKVGEGAFGEVYRAWDVVLEREVALKLMRASDEDPALLQEARMLARLRHRNVVTVYGVDRHDGRSGVWMDFIEGETLAAIVEQRGAFGALEAILVGVDVCGALAAAHQSGLLHRDIKAQNVMRERGGRIVLMDFGLGHETAAGEPTDFGGTPLYMAPELLEGGPATVRSDLYAVGVLLFHLVTRAYPVEGSSIAELRKAHADGEARSLRDLRPDLASSFTRVVEKAFAHEPSHRYATAGQMTAALEGALGRRRLALPVSRRAFWWTATSAAASGAAAIWYRTHRPSAAVTAGASLLLAEISNATGDSQLNAVGDVLRVQLAQSAHFNLLDSDRVKETLVRMTRPPDQKMDLPMVREVALRSATPLVVYGTVSPLGTGYNLSLVIERIEGQPRTPATTESKLFEARNKNGMFDAIHQAATWIRQTAGEAGKDISANDTLPEEATTSSWDALDYFSRGERLFERNQLPDALPIYKQAELKDPKFALALARIAQCQAILRHHTEAFDYWRKAAQALDRQHVTRREEYRIRSLHANDTQDYATAEGQTSTWIQFYPRDVRAHHYRALALRNLGKFEAAREELLTSRHLQNSDSTVSNLIVVNLLLGAGQEASAYLKDLPPAGRAYYGGLTSFLSGDFEGAEALFKSVPHDNAQFSGPAVVARACLLAELGRHLEAMEVFKKGIDDDSLAGRTDSKAGSLVALAHLHLLSGRRDVARRLAHQAVREDSDTLVLLRAGTVLAHAGLSRDARGLLDRMDSASEGPRLEIARAILTAEIALADKHSDEALSAAREAHKLAPRIHPRQFLARVYEGTGHREEALAQWRRIADEAALIWTMEPDLYGPGAWTEAIYHAAALSAQLGQKTDARTYLNRFLEIRNHSDSDDPQSAEARKLLLTL